MDRLYFITRRTLTAIYHNNKALILFFICVLLLPQQGNAVIIYEKKYDFETLTEATAACIARVEGLGYSNGAQYCIWGGAKSSGGGVFCTRRALLRT